MPRVPFQLAQSDVPIVQSPRANPPAAVGAALQRLGSTLSDASDVLGRVAQLEQQAVTEGQYQAATLQGLIRLNELRDTLVQDPEPTTVARRFTEQARAITTDVAAGITDRRGRQKFAFEFGKTLIGAQADVQRDSRRRIGEQAEADFIGLTQQAELALSQGRGDAEQLLQTVEGQRGALRGIVDPVRLQKHFDDFRVRVVTNGMMQWTQGRDPLTALNALNSGRTGDQDIDRMFATLTPIQQDRLRDRVRSDLTAQLALEGRAERERDRRDTRQANEDIRNWHEIDPLALDADVQRTRLLARLRGNPMVEPETYRKLVDTPRAGGEDNPGTVAYLERDILAGHIQRSSEIFDQVGKGISYATARNLAKTWDTVQDRAFNEAKDRIYRSVGIPDQSALAKLLPGDPALRKAGKLLTDLSDASIQAKKNGEPFDAIGLANRLIQGEQQRDGADPAKVQARTQIKSIEDAVGKKGVLRPDGSPWTFGSIADIEAAEKVRVGGVLGAFTSPLLTPQQALNARRALEALNR